MKKRLGFISVFILYLAVFSVLMGFDIAQMVQPLPIVSIVAGIAILTLFRYQKGMPIRRVLECARWNALFSGSLISVLSLLSEITKGIEGFDALTQNLVPLIYGTITYLLFTLALSFMKAEVSQADYTDAFNAETAMPIFRQMGFSERECHIALKLMEGLPNRQIASHLYISESTVKKHIQNLFRKCGAADRHDFVRLYTQWVKEKSDNKNS